MEAEVSSGALSLFDKGGVVMVILFALSLLALTIVLYKAWQFWQWKVLDKSFVEPALRELTAEDPDPDAALALLKRNDTPLSRVMQSTLTCMFNEHLNADKREAEIQRVGNQEVSRLESFMKGLELTAQISPLLGLLGTVIGMINAFSRLEGGGSRVDPSVLAGGIWEALLTTVGGLSIAIPALAAYYMLDAVIEKVRQSMKDVTVRMLALESQLVYPDVPEDSYASGANVAYPPQEYYEAPYDDMSEADYEAPPAMAGYGR